MRLDAPHLFPGHLPAYASLGERGGGVAARMCSLCPPSPLDSGFRRNDGGSARSGLTAGAGMTRFLKWV